MHSARPRANVNNAARIFSRSNTLSVTVEFETLLSEPPVKFNLLGSSGSIHNSSVHLPQRIVALKSIVKLLMHYASGWSIKHLYSHPIIIMATAKIFSPSVVGAMLPKPMLVRLVMVKYKEVM